LFVALMPSLRAIGPLTITINVDPESPDAA
jgi:hypothetical protein